MTQRIVTFDDVPARIRDALGPLKDGVPDCYVVRDLYGRVRIVAEKRESEGEAGERSGFEPFARKLQETLGPRAYPAADAVLLVNRDLLDDLEEAALDVAPGVRMADRLVTGRGWWSAAASDVSPRIPRFTLFSIKGGVGRSTTAAVLSRHLAARGERVLVADLDLESPGLSSAVLTPDRQPEFGVTDWFVEALVGQSDEVIPRMWGEPTWAQDLDGNVHVVPAHGQDPGEYLAKLGRVYLDAPEDWTERLKTLLARLEDHLVPTVVLLESRSGINDIAAATVTDLDAEVLLFGTDSENTWTDYGILFSHFRARDMARGLRERLSLVSALTPELHTDIYLEKFRQKAWELFREHLYDELPPGQEARDEFSFDLHEEHAPHDPAIVLWTRGFAAGASLLELEDAPVDKAYARFLKRFDERVGIARSRETG